MVCLTEIDIPSHKNVTVANGSFCLVVQYSVFICMLTMIFADVNNVCVTMLL